MAEGSDELERLSREQLILKARVLGVERAELMTRVELRDEIVRRSVPDLTQQKRARGFLGVARDLVASVVEAGLNLPDAAKLIRGEGSHEGDWKGPPPVATVTLAEIYAAQGHLDRALRMLDEVLAKEPDHDPARALRDRLAAGDAATGASAPRKRQKISFVEPPPESTEPDPDTDLDAPPVSELPPVPVPVPVPVPDLPTIYASEVVEPTPEITEIAPEIAAPAPTPEQVEAAPPIAATTPEIVVLAPAAAAAPTPELTLLTLSHSARRQVYWEIPDQTFEPLRARVPGGRAVLRVISFRTTRAGKVERQSLDISPHASIGSSELPGLTSDAVVRAALGWEVEGRFTPFVLAADIAAESRAGARPGQFRPHHLVGGASTEAESRALAHLTRRS